MKLAATAVVLTLLLVGAARAQEGHVLRRHPLHLSSEEVFQLFEHADESEPKDVSGFYDKVGERLKGRIGLRPLFTLLPTETDKQRNKGEAEPPTFALVARANGGTLVSLTRPGASADPEDRLFLQRTLVSDLINQRGFSLAVYEDHALDGDALRFLGIGARLQARPALRLFGWGLRLQLFGSFHPEHGGTAYVAISGRPGGALDGAAHPEGD
jgi:hypothetical protein